MKKILFVFVLTLLFPLQAWAAATASLDRSIVSFGESVQLTIKVDGSAADDPDLNVLKQDFDILNQSQSSNYSLINGSFKRSAQWSIALMPKREGVLKIPSISLGNMHTNPLSIRVLAQNTAASAQIKNIFLEVNTSVVEVFVQAQVIVTVKLFRSVNLSQAQLTEPDMAHTIIKKLGDDKNYEMVREQRHFVVTERRYAVFPQQSGTLIIPELQFDGRITDGRSFVGRAVRLRSKAIELNVLPQPDTWLHAHWLPAEKVTVREIWADEPETTFKVGEPFTRTIVLKAKGLTAEQLPTLFAKSPADGDFKQYPDQPKLHTEVHADTVIGERHEKVAFIPLKSGDMLLPGVSIAWWNIQTKRMETAHIAARTIAVQAAQPTSAQDVGASPKNAFESKQDTRLSQDNIENESMAVLLWQALTAFFAVGWLGTVLWWYAKKQAHISVNNTKNKGDYGAVAIKKARRKLEQVCAQHQASQAAAALLDWGKLVLNEHTMHSFSQLKGYASSLDTALDDLQAHLYGKKTQGVWSGDALLQALDALQAKPKEGDMDDGLTSLY